MRAIEEEFDSLEKSGSYTELDQSSAIDPTTKTLPSGIILKMKRDERGSPSRFKARLVARGNLQRLISGEYAELHAPVACFDLFRILLVLSAEFGWTRCHIDIKSAFLYAKLPSTMKILLKLPSIDGIMRANGDTVIMIKSLYG